MMATTIMSSMSVKPLCSVLVVFSAPRIRIAWNDNKNTRHLSKEAGARQFTGLGLATTRERFA